VTAIGLISDVHAAPGPVAEALARFRQAGVAKVFCAGDIAGYHEELAATVDLLVESGCRSIHGNHDLLYLDHLDADGDDAVAAWLRALPACIDTTLADCRLYMVHAHPPEACHGGIKLLDREGRLLAERVAEWRARLHGFAADVLVVGHTHQVFAEWLGDTLVVNPGSTAFNHACAILHLPERRVEFLPLSGQAIVKTWNWGDHVIRGG
jgi:predicted phosphodiesterase